MKRILTPGGGTRCETCVAGSCGERDYRPIAEPSISGTRVIPDPFALIVVAAPNWPGAAQAHMEMIACNSGIAFGFQRTEYEHGSGGNELKSKVHSQKFQSAPEVQPLLHQRAYPNSRQAQ